MRIGLIGCGWIAETHLTNLKALGETVTGVCDPDPERRAWAAGLTGAEEFADWESLLERGEVEAVFVCTPPLLHRVMAEAALERGLPVYLEKPVARDLDDARAIVATAERTGVVCAIGYQWRAISWVPDVRELFADRALGLLAVRSFGGTSGRSWFVDQAAGGGQVLERASHGIDLIQAIAGPAAYVTASGVNVPLAGDDRPAGSAIDDVLSLTLELERGGLATVQVVWQRRELPSTYSLDIIGDGALVECIFDPEFSVTGLADGKPVNLRDERGPYASGLERFLAAARAGAPGDVACTPAQATASLATALACERALTGGGRVKVDAPA